MSKIYDLYPKEQRKIDNQARRIRGYEKMKNDLTNANKRLNRENVKLSKRINEAIEFIDQVLQYHITPFQPNEVDEDINTLIGILRGGSNE